MPLKLNVKQRTVVTPNKQVHPETAQHFTEWQWMTCECGDTYQLGKTGTIYGCDRCQGITRNPVDHSIIIDDPFKQVFSEEGEQS